MEYLKLLCPHCGETSSVAEIGEHIGKVHIGPGGTDWLCSGDCPYLTPSMRDIAAHCLLTGHPVSLITRRRTDETFIRFLEYAQEQFNSSKDSSTTSDPKQDSEDFRWEKMTEPQQSSIEECYSAMEQPYDIYLSAMEPEPREVRQSPPKNRYNPPKRRHRKNESQKESQIESMSKSAAPHPSELVDNWKSDANFNEPVRSSEPRSKTKSPFCTICQAPVAMSGPMNLVDHVFSLKHSARASRSDSGAPWTCDCGRSFLSHSYLKRHLKDHPANHQTRLLRSSKQIMAFLKEAFEDLEQDKLGAWVNGICSRYQ